VLTAATRTIDTLVTAKPPGAEVRGQHFYFPVAAKVPSLLALLMGTPAFSCAESLTGAGTLEVPAQVQVALNIPPFPHRPGGSHIDGYPPLPDGRPGTFTMLAGVLMSDQEGQNGGNLWTWPGSHLTHARYFAEHGPDAFFEAKGYPPVDLPEPTQVMAGPGICCWRTTCWATTSAATSRMTRAGACTSGSSTATMTRTGGGRYRTRGRNIGRSGS
jgi:hypothetical protein